MTLPHREGRDEPDPDRLARITASRVGRRLQKATREAARWARFDFDNNEAAEEARQNYLGGNRG